VTIPAYPAYRASNIEWVGELPLAWAESRIGRLARIYAGGTPDRAQLHYWRDGTIPWINSGAVNQGVIEEHSALITAEAFANSSARWVRPGALVIALAGQGKTKGMVAQMGVAATCNQSMAAIDPADGLLERYLYWWLYSNYRSIRGMGGGDLRDGLNLVHIGGIPVPLPSTAEQRQIADYLDAHTAKIDVLIEKQERLIETLAERLDGAWSSSVSELITSFPSAPLRRVIDSIVDGPFGSSLTSAHYSDEGAGVVRLGNIGVDDFKLDDRAYVPVEYAQSLSAHAVAPGDVVVAGLGDEKMPLGRAAIVPESFGHGIVKADCYRVRPGTKVTAKYIAWILSSPQSRTQFRALSRGSTRQRLNTQVVRDVVIPLPTVGVQNAVVTAFAGKRRSNGALIAKAREMIDVLKERRQALISAAVTGKIDVRGLS
jgi:type I restriction enzyme, S subunit